MAVPKSRDKRKSHSAGKDMKNPILYKHLTDFSTGASCRLSFRPGFTHAEVRISVLKPSENPSKDQQQEDGHEADVTPSHDEVPPKNENEGAADERIFDVRLPKHFDKSTVLKYDEKMDSQEHIDAFEARINLEGVSDAIRCKAFSVTLSGSAMAWFNTATRRTQAKHPISLLEIEQRVGQSIRDYLDRFNKALLEVNMGTPEVVCLCLIASLLEGDFRRHLTSKDVKSMEKIHQIALEYIRDEDVSKVVSIKKKNMQVSHRPRASLNRSQYCDYHKSYGHKTEDCIDLKDALEQTIQDGKLPEFTQHVRPPRRHNDDDDRETRNPRNSKPPENPEDAAQVVVNVVTAKSGLPKSNNIVKRDIKVATSEVLKVTSIPVVQFIVEDFQVATSEDDEPLVITTRLGNDIVKRILVDTGADSNMLIRNAFDALGLKDQHLEPHLPGFLALEIIISSMMGLLTSFSQ
ncbi:uncharacterized protein LOC107640380 [Arachis ipaensis]|uniref:uncharacterized protein LOC107640380 n=1 Tax=Arachis ipaensis TaxID=130454 RepID=UPI0007AFDB7F|nr:uncharacterized protein LOC107640380 [Arachis ipaensis]XP_025652122.1 uncharacterized protein LOC112748128 [Arachis hypogaea]